MKPASGFKIRGANMELIEKGLDRCWNFGRVIFILDNPKSVPLDPNIDPRV
jgi:hypothetical protein